MPQPHDQRRGPVDLITESARDALHVRRVFGEPVVDGGLTIIPVARVRGGHGAGFGSGSMATGGEEADEAGTETPGTERGGEGEGGGGGFGVAVKPLGVFVVVGDDAKWRPVLDVNRVILGGQVVGAVAILAVTHLLRHRATLSARTAVATAPTAAVLRSRLLTAPRLPIPRLHLVRRMTVGTVGIVADAVRRARG